MADYNGSLPSPTNKNRKPASFFLSSPRLLTALASKAFSETESIMSPTSILDSKPFSCFKNPFCSESSTPRFPDSEPKRHWENLDSQKVGLGIFDSLRDEKSEPEVSKPESRKVLFGSQLKIQIPAPPPVLSLSDSPRSPSEFGIKTKNSHLQNSPFGSDHSNSDSSGVFSGCLSVSEIELSEDYTRIICRGPNPRTTHIFDNCIIESCCGVVGLSDLKKKKGFLGDRASDHSESFLSFCHTCKTNLEQDKDIYVYRGEKAFCSHECRYQEMVLDEGGKKMEHEDAHGIFPC